MRSENRGLRCAMMLALSVTSLEPDRQADAASDQATHVVQLGDAIAGLAARLHAATYELLVLLRAFDAASDGPADSSPVRTGSIGAPGSTSAPRARRCASRVRWRRCRS
jgi:hypothetical protein